MRCSRSVLVLKYKTDIRSHGKTVKQRQFLATWSAVAKKLAITELPYGADDVSVKATGNQLEVSHSSKSKQDEAEHVTTQELRLPK